MLGLLLLSASACGKKDADTTTAATTAATMAPMESDTSQAESESESEEKATLEVNASEEETTNKENSSQKETEETISNVQKLASEVKDAVANKDLEAMADLVAYPIGIVSPDGEGMEVANKEEFLKLKPEDVFTDRLIRVIADINVKDLETDKDDLAVMGKGTINIALGLTEEGSLKVVAISR